MLPSQSTLAREPSLFPLCGVGTATPCGLPVSPAGDDVCDAADFGTLIADLDPAETPADPTTPDLGACCLPLLGLALVPPPVALGPVPDVTAGSEAGPAGANEAAGQPDGRSPLLAGRTSARLDWTARESAAGGDGSGQIFGLPGEPGADDAPVSARPSAMANERAMQTPRYAGLPAAALEHRQSAVLPPGIARLQALPAETATGAPIPSVVNAAAASAAGPFETGEFPAPSGGPPMSVRGALPSNAGDPAEAGRAALVRNGLPTEAPGQPRPEQSLPPQEKFAGRGDGFAPAAAESAGARKKSFLGAEEEVLGKRDRSLGTDSAKPANAMPATSLHAPPTHPDSHYAVTSVAAAGQVRSELPPLAEMSETFSTAHEAVEVVLHAIEHVAAREQKSVQLKFAVAGEELAVRVELRADEVRTTFRTDSAELRAALEHEWQQVAGASTATERSVRVSPAVFASTGQSAFNAFAGDSSSRDRRTGPARDEFERPVAGLRGRTVAAAAPELTLPVTATPSRSGGAHRLHTLA